MKFLFVHQGFPGQYRHIVRALAAQRSHQIVALGIEPLAEPIPEGVQYIRYPLDRGTSPSIHPWAAETETKIIRGESCARVAYQLRAQGFFPDIICAHPGWGESLFLKDIWPHCPILCYQEFYYRSQNSDYDFDPEIQGQPGWEDLAKVRMKTVNTLLNLESSDWNVTPTIFQKSTFPKKFSDFISVIHDGIDTHLTNSIPLNAFSLPDGTVLAPGDPIVTFVNRCVEPYRGCHTFIRAIPLIQKLNPRARLVIIGDLNGVSYGRMPSKHPRWCDQFLAEIEGLYDPSRVHFVGRLSYSHFLSILRLSQCHVYFTVPFVLSWSLLEAMSMELPIVASRTLPVEELIQDGSNGLLVDFFSPQDLADAISEVLRNRNNALCLGRSAKTLIYEKYSLEKCVPLHLNLIHSVASRVLKAS